MHSPPMEWGLGIGYLALLDATREDGDADAPDCGPLWPRSCGRCPSSPGHPLGYGGVRSLLGTWAVATGDTA